MAMPWDTPATKYKVKTSSVARSITAEWSSIPWKALHTECMEAQAADAEMAEAENLQRYQDYIRLEERKRIDMNPEVGSYEGNLSDEIPFQAIPKDKMFRIKQLANVRAIDEFITRYGIKGISTSILSQLTKNLSQYKLSDMSGDTYSPVKAVESLMADSTEGLVDAGRLYRQAFSDDTMMGIYHLLMLDTRSLLLEKQYALPARSYCALVPLIMNAFKLHNAVPYSHWNRSGIRGITNLKLADAMLCEDALPSADEILEARDIGLMTKTGSKAGQVRNPSFTYKLYGKTVLSDYPEYVQVMAAQIWCAHPQNRTKFMVLDHLNWDKIPTPLINNESIVSNARVSVKDTGLPW